MQELVGRFARADRSPPVPASPRVRSTEAYPRAGRRFTSQSQQAYHSVPSQNIAPQAAPA